LHTIFIFVQFVALKPPSFCAFNSRSALNLQSFEACPAWASCVLAAPLRMLREKPDGFANRMEVIQMTNSPVFRTFACLVIVAFFVCGQQALAQEKPHFQIKVLPRATADVTPTPALTPAANLYALQAAFTQGYPTPGANADGTDIWPCFGNSSTPNTDCPTIGNPSITFPSGAAALGAPAYVWQLANPGANGYGCDADTNGTSNTSYLPCGQTETWYEDDTNDSTDELLYEIEVTQGSTVIADSGEVDFGPNTFGGLTPPADVIIYGDQNFGTWPGAGSGKNTGNCDADFNYPLTAAANPGATYVVEANKTCGNPVAGAATLSAVTEVGKPVYTKSTSKTVCGSVGTPCYTVKWTKKYSITQKWTIFFE
jgi:hypothetical protein